MKDVHDTTLQSKLDDDNGDEGLRFCKAFSVPTKLAVETIHSPEGRVSAAKSISPSERNFTSWASPAPASEPNPPSPPSLHPKTPHHPDSAPSTAANRQIY